MHPFWSLGVTTLSLSVSGTGDDNDVRAKNVYEGESIID
jgi:hypothetical protein